MKYLIQLTFLGISLTLTPAAQAALSLHGLFSDHGVLQRGVQVPVWGNTDAGATVNVSFAGQTKSTTADNNGQWMIKLDPMSANANGQTLTATSTGQTETRTDILVGEVWLTSGQSNMTSELISADTFNLPLSIPAAGAPSPTPSLRVLLMNVGGTSEQPSQNLNANEKWKLSDRAGIQYFSAVSFYYGRALTQALNIPVGIISASAGGTGISQWMPDSGINYNYGISPLQPYAIKGVIWYQGEANAKNHLVNNYYNELVTMIDGWRSKWATAGGTPKRAFPFYFVQLPNYEADVQADAWIKIREQMLRASLDTEHTAMAVTIDVGDANNIHPTRKQPVGERLARIARALDYGENITYSGPLYQSMSVEGNIATLSFSHAGGGLVSSNGQAPKYFEIAGSNNIYHNAQANISGNTIQVSSNAVPAPVKVRYAWNTNPENPNFANSEGLMASPFRSDADFWINAGVSINPSTGLITKEDGGGTATFSVALTTAPNADVTLKLTSSNPGEGTVNPTSLTFTPGNWNTPRSVTITGIDDQINDGDQNYQIITSNTSSNDPRFTHINPADISVTNLAKATPIPTYPVAAGLATVSDAWQTVTTNGPDNAVIILGPPTFHGSNPGVLQLKHVVNGTFEIRFHEWSPGDGQHLIENVNYLTLAQGIHELDDGTVLEVGTFTQNGTADWLHQSFNHTFPAAPALFLTAQTANDTDAIVVRAKNVSRNGFESALYEEEALMNGHAQETIGYLALYNSKGWGTLDITDTPTPWVTQQAAVNHRFTPVLTANLKVEEDQSADSETRHLAETINVLAIGRQLFAQEISSIGGNTISLRQISADDSSLVEWGVINGITHNWLRIPLKKSYTDPVVVVKPVSDNGGQGGAMRLRNVGPDSFEVRYGEWDFFNDIHLAEQTFYLVAEAGSRTLGGLNIQAGKLFSNKLARQGQWEKINTPFAQPPAVFSAAQTENNPDTVTTRMRGVTHRGFELSMTEQEANTDGHSIETLGWIAIETGSGVTTGQRHFETFTNSVSSARKTIPFTATNRHYPVVVSDIMTTLGLNPVTIRFHQPVTSSGIELFLQEEPSMDHELYHLFEDISVFVGQ